MLEFPPFCSHGKLPGWKSEWLGGVGERHKKQDRNTVARSTAFQRDAFTPLKTIAHCRGRLDLPFCERIVSSSLPAAAAVYGSMEHCVCVCVFALYCCVSRQCIVKECVYSCNIILSPHNTLHTHTVGRDGGPLGVEGCHNLFLPFFFLTSFVAVSVCVCVCISVSACVPVLLFARAPFHKQKVFCQRVREKLILPYFIYAFKSVLPRCRSAHFPVHLESQWGRKKSHRSASSTPSVGPRAPCAICPQVVRFPL